MKGGDTSRVLALQFGGIGDLVLISELVASLKTSHPEWTVAIACRAEFAAITSLFPVVPDEVIGLDLNPYLADSPSEGLRHKLEEIAQRFAGFHADILIDGSLRPTWLAGFLAALLRPGQSCCCAGAPEPQVILSIILEWFRLPRRALIDLGPPAEMLERDRYRLLLDYLGIRRTPGFPWHAPSEWESQAHDWLRTNGLPDGGFVACFPGGTAVTSVKRWPRTNFIDTIDFIRSRGFPVLLLGDSAEREELTTIALALAGGPAPVFFGDSISLPLGAAVLSAAAGYLGNDTGPMHLAQAFGVPGVAIFGGGGQWPRYAPWAAGSIGLVHPLPCFGCDWDCFLGRALCVDSVPVETVSMALLSALNGSSGEPRIEQVRTLDPGILPLIADASARYRSVQKDRSKRLEVIAGLQAIAGERLALVESIHAEAATRSSIIEELTAIISERDARIADLERTLAANRAGRDQPAE